MDNKELEEQIVSLTARVYELEQQVKNIKNHTKSYIVPEHEKEEENILDLPIKDSETDSAIKESESSSLNQSIIETEDIAQPESNKAISTHDNLESHIGKKIMGVAASILVLFSFILFGSLLYPHITDGMKVCLMFAVSFGFAVTGICKLNSSSKYQTLFSCFAGCGISAIYISCLVTCYNFHLITETSLVFILIVWLMITNILAKYKSKMFLYICNVGLIIASVIANFNLLQAPIGVILYFIGIIVLFITNNSKIYNKDCYFFTQMHFLSLIYIVCHYQVKAIPTIITILNLAIYILAHIYYKIESEKDSVLSIINQVLSMLGCMLTLTIIHPFKPYEYLVLLLIGIILTSFQYLKYNNKNNKLWLVSYYITLVSSLFCNEGFIDNYLSFIPMCIILFIIDHFLVNNHFKYATFAFITLANLVPPSILELYIVFVLTLIFIAYYIFKYFKEKYYFADKFLLSYVFFFSLFTLFNTYNVQNFTIFITLGLLSLFFNSKLYRLDYISKKEEKPSTILSYIYNLLLIISGILFILFFNKSYAISSSIILSPSVTGIIIIILTLILSTINIKHLFASSVPTNISSIYTSTKLLIILFSVMYRLEFISLLVSLVTIVFAVMCIGAGFKIDNKPLRLYGLTLTLLFVLKLVLFDIQYDNAILRPVAFLCSGLLCFIVSWLYSKLEKQIIEKNTEQENQIQ